MLAKFADAAGNLVDSAVVESGGNVGVGTATPNAKLDVSQVTGGNGIRRSAFNMLTRAEGNGAVTTYGYDADGQRRWRIGANGTEYFVHGPGFVPLAEYREVEGVPTLQREYIYAGSRLIASIAPATGGTPPTYTFTDDPLVAGETSVKAVHLTELRAAINTARALWDLPAIDPWPTDPVVAQNVTVVKKAHLDEMRSAIVAAYTAANAAPPSFTDPNISANETPIKAAHFNELRAAVRNLPAPTDGGTVYYHQEVVQTGCRTADERERWTNRIAVPLRRRHCSSASILLHIASRSSVRPGQPGTS